MSFGICARMLLLYINMQGIRGMVCLSELATIYVKDFMLSTKLY